MGSHDPQEITDDGTEINGPWKSREDVFQFLMRQLLTPTLIPSILIHRPYLMSIREYFSRQRTLSSDLWKRKRMERQLIFSFGLEDILQRPLSVVSTNDVMVAWSRMWWTLRYAHVTRHSRRTMSPFLLSEMEISGRCWWHAKGGCLWYCHFTDVLYFPAANLRCGNNDLELHSTLY